MHLPPILLSLAITALLHPSAALAAKTPKPETTVTLRIPPAPPALPNPHVLPASTRATLTTLGAALSAPLSAANTFVFTNVSAGSYLADVHCATHAFAPLRVDVLRGGEAVDGGSSEGEAVLRVRAWETYRGNDWGNMGEEVRAAEGGVLDVRVLGQKGYFMERSSCECLACWLEGRGIRLGEAVC